MRSNKKAHEELCTTNVALRRLHWTTCCEKNSILQFLWSIQSNEIQTKSKSDGKVKNEHGERLRLKLTQLRFKKSVDRTVVPRWTRVKFEAPRGLEIHSNFSRVTSWIFLGHFSYISSISRIRDDLKFEVELLFRHMSATFRPHFGQQRRSPCAGHRVSEGKEFLGHCVIIKNGSHRFLWSFAAQKYFLLRHAHWYLDVY